MRCPRRSARPRTAARMPASRIAVARFSLTGITIRARRRTRRAAQLEGPPEPGRVLRQEAPSSARSRRPACGSRARREGAEEEVRVHEVGVEACAAHGAVAAEPGRDVCRDADRGRAVRITRPPRRELGAHDRDGWRCRAHRGDDRGEGRRRPRGVRPRARARGRRHPSPAPSSLGYDVVTKRTRSRLIASRKRRAQSSRLSARHSSMPARRSPLRCRSSRRVAARASTKPRSRNDCDAKTSRARSPSAPRRNRPSGVTKPSLSRRPATVGRQQIGERATEDGLRLAAAGSARRRRARRRARRAGGRAAARAPRASAPSSCDPRSGAARAGRVA